MNRRDLPEVLSIEESSFEFPWSESDFVRLLSQRNGVGWVVEVCPGKQRERVVGYMVYQLAKTRIDLLNLAVAPDHRGAGLGRALLAKVKSKLSAERRARIATEVRETNLAAQLFLRACGFRATSVLRDFYDDTTEDAYHFVYRLPRGELLAQPAGCSPSHQQDERPRE
jgi:ribosomal-protein-alanine N-acetyltransferase